MLRLSLLSRPVRLSRRGRAGPLRRAILSLRAGLTRRVIAWIISGRIGLPQRALLADDLAADALRGVDLAHDALVALGLLRRDRQRQRGKAAASAGADRKAARALRQRTEPRAVAAIDLDPADPPVRIGIELDRDIVGVSGGGALRDFDQAGGAANAERRRWRRYFHVAGLGDGGGDKGHRSLGDIEQRGVLLAAVFIDVVVDRMSSFSLSGVAALLRVTVALPVSVATLPIGSSLAAGAGVVAGAGAGACAGCVCASFVESEIASHVREKSSCGGDGIATAFAAPASMKPPTSQSAKNRCLVTIGNPGKKGET